MSITKYNGKPKNSSIQSVYGLLEWNDKSLSNKSKIKLTQKKNSITKILIQFTDKDCIDNKYVNWSPNNYYYNFYHWSHIDVFIYTSTGLFSIPPSGYINAAHLNGTIILGSLMAPVNQSQYTNQFKYLFREKNGIYPCAKKMVQIMDYYGFDGWFINIEELLPDNVSWINVQQFMIYLVKESKKVNVSAEIHWYDSNYVFGSMDYENELNKKNINMFQDKQIVSDGFFLNYDWDTNKLNNSKLISEHVNRNPNNVYASLYMDDLDNITDKIKIIMQSGLSIGIWNMNYIREVSNTKQQLDNYNNDLWLSISSIIKPSKIPNSYPFNTFFSDGQGYAFYIKGQKISNYAWGCMSQQDIALTINNKYTNDQFRCSLNTDTAYEGGTSILYQKIKDIDKVTRFKLFNVNFEMDLVMDFKIVVSNDRTINFDIEFDYNGTLEVLNNRIKTQLDYGWIEYKYKLEYANKCTLNNINILLSGGNLYDQFYLGQVYLNKINNVVRQVSNLISKNLEWKIDNCSFIYLNLTLEWTDDISRYYDIYILKPDYSEYMWLARAYNNYYRIEELCVKGDILWTNNNIYFCVLPTDYAGNTLSLSDNNINVCVMWELTNSYLDMIDKEINT